MSARREDVAHLRHGGAFGGNKAAPGFTPGAHT